MMSIFYEMKFALRSVTKSFGFTLLSVSMLGFGLGATIFMFTAIKAYILSPLPFENSHEIMHVERGHELRERFNAEISIHEFLALREAQTQFEDLSGFYGGTVNLSDDDLPTRLDGSFIHGSAFKMLRVNPILGRTLTAEDSRPGGSDVVLLGHTIWQQRYNADRNIVGKTIRVNGKPMTIVGVMPEGFKFPIREEIWLPMDTDATKEIWGSGITLEVFGRALPGVSHQQAKADLDGVFAAFAETHPETNEGFHAVVKPYEEEFVSSDQRALMWMMFGAVIAVLMIACANVANLILARTATRQKEIAIRTALGASRLRIVMQVLSEALLVSLVGAGLGVWIASLGLDGIDYAFVANDISEPFWVDLSIDARVIAFAFLIAFFAAVVAGLAPALKASRTDVNENIKDGAKGSGVSVGALSRILVTGEIAVSCMLLIGAGVMIRSVMTLNEIDLGANTQGLLSGRIGLMEADYPEEVQRAEFFQELVDRLEATPGVQNAAATISLPGMFGYQNNYSLQDKPLVEDSEQLGTHWVASTPEYFDTMEISLLEGRLFDERDRPDTQPVVVIDQAFAQENWPGESALGKQVRLGRNSDPNSEWMSVIGIVSNSHHDQVDQEVKHTVFQPVLQQSARFMTVVIRTEGEPMAFGNTFRETLRGIDPNLPIYWLRTIDQWIAIGMFTANIISTLFAIFAFVGILLAAAGIYGVLAYSVSQRTREIGVRRALGALDKRILGMVLKQSLWQLMIGLSAGLILGLLFSYGLSRFWVLAEIFDPVMFFAVAILLTLVALLAALVPAFRAIRVDPMEALRYE